MTRRTLLATPLATLAVTPERVSFFYRGKQCQAAVERYDGFVILRAHIPGRKMSNLNVCGDTLTAALRSLHTALDRDGTRQDPT